MSVEQPIQHTSTDIPQQANRWVPGSGMPAVPTGVRMQGYTPQPAGGPIGNVRGTGACTLLAVVTLGIYALVWFYQPHEEMKRHTGQGLGGTVALLIALFLGLASPYLTSNEVGSMFERRGQAKPVRGLTGLWYLPGVFLVVGRLIWFIKTNGALNAYWRSLGARWLAPLHVGALTDTVLGGPQGGSAAAALAESDAAISARARYVPDRSPGTGADRAGRVEGAARPRDTHMHLGGGHRTAGLERLTLSPGSRRCSPSGQVGGTRF